MSDETNAPAETPAEVDLTTKIEDPVEPEQEQPKPEEETKAEEPSKEEAEAEDDEDKPRKRSGAQRAKARERALLAELAERDRRLEELSRQVKPEESASPPKEEDFNGDWGAYIAARAAYEASRAIKGELSASEAKVREAKQAEIWREKLADHEERKEEAREVITDFDKVLSSVQITITEELGREIVDSDKSALIQYHLAQNPNELHRLNRLSGRELARELGRLEAKLEYPKAKKATTAPPPIKPLTGGAKGSFDPEKASMEEYVAKRASGWRG